jgi:hypothetical protein
MALTYLVGVAVSTVAVVAPVVLYFQLRVVKDALDLDRLASLVDAIAARGAAGGEAPAGSA